ncbi:MAG: acyl-CoA thioester hydrolase [Chloroflexia bacterium]|jgi:acyl-CoA thioester hydrolase|nr:acyl-CoA thioester hydrolase [Chloroflexia bacterium]
MMSRGDETARQQIGWKFCLTVEVRFRDVDMFGHVNNAAYLTYIESARVAYYAHLTGLKDPREFDMTVARAEVDFLKPVFYGQTLHVYTRAGRIGNKSWTLEHEMRDSQSGEVVARGSTVIVHFDHVTQASKPLPPEIVELIERHEGRSLRSR